MAYSIKLTKSQLHTNKLPRDLVRSCVHLACHLYDQCPKLEQDGKLPLSFCSAPDRLDSFPSCWVSTMSSDAVRCWEQTDQLPREIPV